jgi:hypothetical protein
MSNIKRNNEKGSVLVMAVVLSFAMFLLGLSFLSSVDSLEKSVGDAIANVQWPYDAQAGATFYNTVVKTGGNYPGSYSRWFNFYNNNWYRGKVNFGGIIEDGVVYTTARGYSVTAQGRSTFYGTDYMYIGRVILYEIQETFADYLYISDCEEDPLRNEHIYFWGPDTLDGKVHSNDTLFTQVGYGSWPRFMKRVTSCAPVIMPPYNQATFDEGFYPNSPPIIFPDQAEEIRDRTFRRNFGTFDPDSVTELTLDRNRIHVRYCGPFFNGEDTVLRCNPPYISDSEVITVFAAEAALFVHGKVFIKADRGGIDKMDYNFVSQGFEGRLTIASSDTMVIYDNLVYKNAYPDNSVPTNINDCLGLISESAIMMGDSVADTLYVNAALASIGGTISVRDIYDYGTYGDPNENEKQSLFIYGSLAMRNRGLVHTSYNNWGHRGFIEKDYHYDTRLQMDPPPYFIKTREHNVIYAEAIEEDE